MYTKSYKIPDNWGCDEAVTPHNLSEKKRNKNILRLSRYFHLIPDIDLDNISRKIEDSSLFRNYYRKMEFNCSPNVDWSNHISMVTLEYVISKFFKDDYYKETSDIFNVKSTSTDRQVIKRSLSYGKHYKRINKNNFIVVTVKLDVSDNNDKNEYTYKFGKIISRYDNDTRLIVPMTDEIIYTIELFGDKCEYYYNKILEMFLKFDKHIEHMISGKSVRYFYCEYSNHILPRYSNLITEKSVNHIKYPMLENEISLLETFVKNRDLIKSINSKSKMGVLLYGPPGTGKSTFAKYISSKLKMDIYDMAFDFDADYDIECNNKLTPYEKPKNKIILIDELDLIIQNNYKNDEYTRDNSNNKRVQAIIKFIDSVGDGCIIIATTNNIDIIDDRLKRPGRFDIIKELNPVNSNNIDYILDTYDDIDKDEIYKLIQDKYNEYITMAEIEDMIVTYKLNKLGLNKKSQLNLQEDYT